MDWTEELAKKALEVLERENGEEYIEQLQWQCKHEIELELERNMLDPEFVAAMIEDEYRLKGTVSSPAVEGLLKCARYWRAVAKEHGEEVCRLHNEQLAKLQPSS